MIIIEIISSHNDKFIILTDTMMLMAIQSYLGIILSNANTTITLDYKQQPYSVIIAYQHSLQWLNQ